MGNPSLRLSEVLVNIFLSINFSVRFGYSEVRRTVSLRRVFEVPQHMYSMRNKKEKILIKHSYLEACITEVYFVDFSAYISAIHRGVDTCSLKFKVCGIG